MAISRILLKKPLKKIANGWIAQIRFILAILLLTTSCSFQREPASTSNQSEPLQGQILLWVERPFSLTETQGLKSQEVLRDALEEFRELYPQVQILVKFFPARRIWEPFELQVKRGAGPDLMLVYGTTKMARLIEMGALRAIDDSEVDQSQFRPEALKYARYRGQLYGLPMYLSTQVLCYNKDKVKELPQTLPELIQQARRGYSVGLDSGFVETFWGTGVFGGQMFDPQGRVILDRGGGWARWMEWLKRAQNEPNFILSDDDQALLEAFGAGKLAYLTCSSGSIAYLRETLGENKLGATLLPGGANQPATPVLRTGLLSFNRASSANQTQIALKLAQFLTNVEQQSRIEAAIPFIPSNNQVNLNRSLFPLRAALLDQSRTAVAVALDDAEKIEAIKDYGNTLYQQVLVGAIPAEEAATKLTQTVNRQFEAQE